MGKMTLARIQELDKRCDEEIRKFLQLGTAYGSPPPFFLEPECVDRLPEMAKKFEVSFEEFRTYVGVRAYIDISARTDCVELPKPEDIARRLGIPFGEFNEYLLAQIKLIHDAFIQDEDEAFALRAEPEVWDLKEEDS